MRPRAKIATTLMESGEMETAVRARYAGWDDAKAQAMLKGPLEAAAARVIDEKIEPQPKSGRQGLENLWNRFI